MSGQVSVGVIGHVDHGKTSLVKALTGMDTDRLREEKDRGMSIVLGFAYIDDDDTSIDLIDVPGHEDFVRTMIAGASGIDAALLVIDVNEGIKPQTVEHLAIAELIGVRSGVIAFTKCDTATAAQRAEAARRLRMFLRGRSLEFAPVIFTSVRSGEGMNELRLALQGLPSIRGGRRPDTGSFYLPVDRAFSIAGRGTVVTGTLRMGRLRVGDELEIMPHARRAQVRQLEFHHRTVDVAYAGQRVGVNLRHVKPQDIARGDALAPPGLLAASTLLDAHVELPRGTNLILHDGQSVRLLFGTTDVAARVRLLGCPPGGRIVAGQEAIVQLRTQRPVAAAAGEAFILRRESPAATIGGGRFLDPRAERHRRSDRSTLDGLRILAQGGAEEVLVERVKSAGYAGAGLKSLAAELGRREDELASAVATGAQVIVLDGVVFYRPFLAALGDMLCAGIDKFHRRFPMRAGVPLSHCRSCLPATVGDSLFRSVLSALSASRRVEQHGGMVRRFGFDPFASLSEHDQAAARAIEADFRRGGATPPDIDQVVNGDPRREALFYMLVERGELVLLPGEHPGRKLAFHRDAVDEACRRMHGVYPAPAQFTVSEARALLGSTRKFMVPLLEYLDASGYTRRRGDKRVLVKGQGGTADRNIVPDR